MACVVVPQVLSRPQLIFPCQTSIFGMNWFEFSAAESKQLKINISQHSFWIQILPNKIPSNPPHQDLFKNTKGAFQFVQNFQLCFNLTSLNPVPNAQVCVFDGTYYKITITNYINIMWNRIFQRVSLLVILMSFWLLSKLPKHYHATQWMYAYILICFRALCGEYMLGLLLILISKSWGWPPPPPGLGMPFLDSNTCAERARLFICARIFFSVWCHPWMDDETNGWMNEWVMWKSFTKNDHDIFYYM